MLPEEQYKMIHRLLVRPYHRTEQLKYTDSTKAHTFIVITKCAKYTKTTSPITWNSKTIKYKHTYFFFFHFYSPTVIPWTKTLLFIYRFTQVSTQPSFQLVFQLRVFPLTFHLYCAKLLWMLHQSSCEVRNFQKWLWDNPSTRLQSNWGLIVWFSDPAGAVMGFEYTTMCLP